jgi:hypothetical protein
MKLKPLTSRLADGIVFQFLMVGALSFSHIHDVVAAHGQAGWKSWLYPPSVDLLTVAAYRKIRANRRDGMAWCAFLLGLAASLAANVVDAWGAVPAGLVLAVAIGVWPAVALLVCTLLSHAPEPAESATVPAESATAPVPASTVPAASSVPAQPVVAVQVTNQVAAVAPTATGEELPPIAPPLLSWARGIADQHRQTTGTPITPDALATRLRIAPALAETVHAHLTAETAGA